MFCTEHHRRPVFPMFVPCQKIEHRLRPVFSRRCAIKQPVEKLGHRLGSRCRENEYPSGKFMIMIQFRFFYRSNIFKDSCIVFRRKGLSLSGKRVKQPRSITLKRKCPTGNRLKMMMIRSRGTAFRPVVHECVSGICPGHIQHVHIAFPDGLRTMSVHGYYEMFMKNRIRIDKNVIFSSFSAFKFEPDLLRGTVVPAQKAFSPKYCLLADIRRGGNYSCRIVLHPDVKPADRQGLDTDIFQCTVIVPGQWPDRKLVIGKVIQLLLFHFSCSFLSLPRFPMS